MKSDNSATPANSSSFTSSSATSSSATAPRSRFVDEVPLPLARQRVAEHLTIVPQGFLFCGMTTLDIEAYKTFISECRRARLRPPSLYAYFARCLGVLIEPQRELIAAKWRQSLLVPSRVDIKMAAEIENEAGQKTPCFFIVQDVGNRLLPDIADEVRTRLHDIKRGNAPSVPEVGRFLSPAWAPLWWRDSVKKARSLTPKERRHRAAQAAYVQISSTSQWMNGQVGWGVQTFQMAALSITLGGLSRRAVVVGDEIVPRWCVDVVLHFDHLVNDGAPATRFISQLFKEVESGRLLREYDLSHPPHNTSSTRTDLIGSSHSETREEAFNQIAHEKRTPVARYNESRA